MKIFTKQEIEITPQILAKCFAEMNNDEQAEFFEAVHNEFDGKDFDTQMFFAYKVASVEAIEIMQIIGSQGEK